MKNRNVAVIGLQWGDEGKGKIVDRLAGASRYVVRYCGGANAGHTVLVGSEKFALHLIPCGVLTDGVVNVIGNGVAFDPAVAMEEIENLRARGMTADERNLRISANAHVVMPWHKKHDVLSEKQLAAGSKIGTTARGIGPCYSDKTNRSTAVRVADLVDADRLRQRVAEIVEIKNKVFAALYGAEPMDGEAILAEYAEYGRRLAPMVCNTGAILQQALAAGERIMFEGGQGSMLDIDHGTFPFVTSSGVTACGIPGGAGVPPAAVGQIVGLVKAYSTRVGAGPFPTEQDNETGSYLRERGHEYGTTTGRPRRCGWFDAFAVRYAADLSGVNELAISLLDVLTGLEQINVCTGYRVDGSGLDYVDPSVMHRAECVYESLPGWEEDITSCKTFEDLPAAARQYVQRIEKLVGRPAGFISVGPEREQTILHKTRIEGLG